MVEGFDFGAARSFDQEEASDHALPVVRGEGTRHDDGNAEARGIRQKRLVGVVVRQPRRERVGTVEGMNCKQHRDLREP